LSVTRKFKSLINKKEYEVRAEIINELLFLHCTVYEWSPSIYKKLKKDWQVTLSKLSKYGYVTVFSVVNESDTLTIKFNKMFGMKEATRENGKVLFSQEIV